jgi:hypothetical protein
VSSATVVDRIILYNLAVRTLHRGDMQHLGVGLAYRDGDPAGRCSGGPVAQQGPEASAVTDL